MVRIWGHGSKSEPFRIRTTIDHSKSELVRISDPHCILFFRICSSRRYLVLFGDFYLQSRPKTRTSSDFEWLIVVRMRNGSDFEPWCEIRTMAQNPNKVPWRNDPNEPFQKSSERPFDVRTFEFRMVQNLNLRMVLMVEWSGFPGSDFGWSLYVF